MFVEDIDKTPLPSEVRCILTEAKEMADSIPVREGRYLLEGWWETGL